jgi:hypothetical protein
MIKRTVLCIAAMALLAACGQKASTRNNSVTSPAPAASVTQGEQTRAERNAMPAATMAPMYGATSCNGGAPVWINERTHVYHVQGDPYYGRTKKGRYVCEGDAVKEGYHKAHTSQ